VVPPRRLSDVERHDHHVDVRLMRERVGDPSARPIVEQKMPAAVEVPAWHDQRDLRIVPLELRDVPPQAPFDVAVGAFLDIQRDPSQVAGGEPTVDQGGGPVGITRRVDATNDRRVDPVGVVRGLQDRTVEILDQHDRDVALPRENLDTSVPHVMAIATVIADDHDADVRDIAEPLRESGPRPASTEPSSQPFVRRRRHDQRHLGIGRIPGCDVRTDGVA